jgi:hypothetical protein
MIGRNESKFTPILRKRFDSMDDAFSYCREADRPVTIFVGKRLWKLYPSGRAEELDSSTTPAIDVEKV